MHESPAMAAAFARPDARSNVTVLIVHDEELFHYGWRLLLSRQEWVSRCLATRTTVEAVEVAARCRPDVAVLDLDSRRRHVAEDVAAMRAAAPNLAVLLVSRSAPIGARAAREMGVMGVVDRMVSARHLATAVRAVASGRRLFAASAPACAGRLSDREVEVLTLMSGGATNREIASQLVVSTETVKRHAANIFRKLGVRNRTQAAQRGRELGLIDSAQLERPLALA